MIKAIIIIMTLSTDGGAANDILQEDFNSMEECTAFISNYQKIEHLRNGWILGITDFKGVCVTNPERG